MRAAYVRYLRDRLVAPRPFLPEAPVPSELTYDYAVIRVVPRVERGEQVNVGVILSCVDAEFLEGRIEVDEARLRALDPDARSRRGARRARLFPVVCAGGAAAGPIGDLPPRGRFRWLVSPRSTVIQASPVHTGRTADPAAALQRLFERMVRAVRRRRLSVCGSAALNSG